MQNADLNCGCPTPDVTGQGMGAALLERPEKLHELVRGMVSSLPGVPVSVKVRTGIGDARHGTRSLERPRYQAVSDDHVGTEQCPGVNVREVIDAVVSAGASAVTIHGRTWGDRYTKLADWYQIAEVYSAQLPP